MKSRRESSRIGLEITNKAQDIPDEKTQPK